MAKETLANTTGEYKFLPHQQRFLDSIRDDLQIELLTDDGKTRSPLFPLFMSRVGMGLDLKASRGIFLDPCFDMAPPRPVTSIHAYLLIGHHLPAIKPSRHRSVRMWKKLLRRGATPMYDPTPRTLQLSPALVNQLKQAGAITLDANSLRL